MKILYIPIIFFILFNCGSSNTETNKSPRIKTFKNQSLIVNYPKSWIKFGGMDYVYFMPKEIRNTTFENEVENVSVNKNQIQIIDLNLIEEVLENYGNTLTRNELKKEFKLVKLNSQSKFIYKMESLVTYNFDETIYKRVEYFYVRNDSLKYYKYQMREDLFDSYLEDALFIINSVEHKN